MQAIPIALARPLLFSDRGCPFAHRVLALLHHLGVPHDVKEAAVGELPEGLARFSPSARIPLLVHGTIVIGESRVMLEHLAEAYAFQDAYPRAQTERTEARHAMALLDVFIAPTLTRLELRVGDARLAECLDVFERVALPTPPSPSLLAFHFAPVWQRLSWWHPDGLVTSAIHRRPALASWLGEAAGLEAIVRTSPTRADNVADFEAICAIHAAAR